MIPIADKPSYINSKHKEIVFIRISPCDIIIQGFKPDHSYYIAYKNGKRHSELDNDYLDSEFIKLNN